MKRIATILILSAGLATAPAMAGQRQDIDGAIGATVGALVGSQIGHGKARLATTAVGAVGGFIIGQNVARNGRGYDRDRDYRREEHRYYGHYRHRLEPVHEILVARTTSNVRAGPGTWFGITDTIYRHEPVRVVAKVEGRDWLMIDQHGRRGFVYAPLLRPRYDRDDDHWRHEHHERRMWGH
ncbi:MAG: glycine zipper 2TM domain-containing protein [Arenicellales bacterium]